MGPVIAKMAAVAKACGNIFQLLQGHSAETSGGLLICLPREQAALTAKTSKSKKVTKLGLSVLWKRDNALRVSLTNLELLKSLPRRRRVNFGKKKVPFGLFFFKSKKSNPLPHRKKFHNFYFEEKNPQLLLATCHLTKLYSKCI